MARVIFCWLMLTASITLSWAQPTELFNPIGFQRTAAEVNAVDRGPVVGDLTGDGLPEIIVVAAGAQSDDRDRILIFNAGHTSTPLFELDPNLPAEFNINGTPAIADVDGDGLMEVVVGATQKRHFTGDNCPNVGSTAHNGGCDHWDSYVLKWEFTDELTTPEFYSQLFVNSGKYSTPIAADLGEYEGLTHADELVFIGSYSHGLYYYNQEYYSRWSNILAIMRWNGQSWARNTEVIQCHNFDCPGDYEHTISDGYVAIGDIDGNGQPEIVSILPNSDGEVRLWIRTETNPVQQSFTTLNGKCMLSVADESKAAPAPVLCDYDLDGQLEAIFPVAQDNEGAGVEQMARVEFSSSTPVEPVQITYRDLPIGFSTHGRYAMAVADEPYSHSDLDAVITARMDANENVNFLWFQPISQSWSDGPPPIQNWPKTILQANAWWKHGYTPAIAATLGGTDLQLVTQTVQSPATNRYHHFRMDNNYGADAQWTVTGDRYSNQPILSASTVTDLNGDGQAELVTLFGTSATHAQIHAYEIGAYSPEHVEWNGFQNGPKHTGLYAQPVSGVQPQEVMKWSGRIIVHGYYQVNADQTLIIEPGTVVEFRDNPGASLYVYGALQAEGSAYDSIYFKSDGAGQWGGIYCIDSPSSRFINCVIHDGDVIYTDHGMDFLIEQCHIYNMNIGLDVTDSRNDATGITERVGR